MDTLPKGYRIRAGKTRMTFDGQIIYCLELLRWESRMVGFLWNRRPEFHWRVIDRETFEYGHRGTALGRLMETIEMDQETREIELRWADR